MENVNKKKLSSLILLVDFQKSFDSLSHAYIQNTMKLFGFGDSILNWISHFYDGRDARVMMRGNLTDRIFLKCGVLQGDIISPYVFILTVEILLIKINFTKNIRGVNFAKKESRSETFANDTSFFLIKDPRYLRAAVRYLDAFSKISSLKCNISKTKVIPIGTFDKTNICPEINFQWTDTFTLLGFFIDNKLTKLGSNLERINEKVCNLINKWHHYNLSIHGRITVAKSVLIAQYVYILTILDLDEDKLETYSV